ncbi:hypothetical protein [Arsenicibacter rosenii]|nr:hypothetical protein [Arsenicibacter rosenii]
MAKKSVRDKVTDARPPRWKAWGAMLLLILMLVSMILAGILFSIA